MTKRRASIVLSDGTVFDGYHFGSAQPSAGEVVFNTGMVGYPEALTDPSYYGQILVLSYPLIGNYGVPSADRDEHGILRHFESERIQVKGLVTSNYHSEYHHWNAAQSLGEWMETESVPGIYGVDTRALTRHLRDRGTMLGKIMVEGKSEPEWYDPSTENVVERVSRSDPIEYGLGDVQIAVWDCGLKNNMLRCLLKRGVGLTVIPSHYNPNDFEFDGLLLTNGPGDPGQCTPVVDSMQLMLADPRPIFGICLGCQVLGLAAGARTFKLPYGHRGQNQPVFDLETGKCAITSQNHGYAVDPESLPADWEVWFRNGNDGTLEGLRQRGRRHFAVQFHPEAVCGPVDMAYLFDLFIGEIRASKRGA